MLYSLLEGKARCSASAMATTKKTNYSEREGGDHHFLPKSLHFFKIILKDTLQSGRLVFPKRFIKLYGQDLSNAVIIRVPTDDVWEMELQRCNGTVWLEKGWREFARFYSLQFGHFLMFKYVEKAEVSEFQVAIFDKSTVEIKYPMMKPNVPVRSTPINNESIVDDDDDAFTSTISESDNSSFPSSPSLKRMKKCNGKASCSRLGKPHHQDNMEDKQKHIDYKAGVFQPDSAEYPLFQMVIKSSDLRHGVHGTMPWSFVKTNLKWEQKEQFLTLKTTGGRSWQVMLRSYPQNFYARLSAGFSDFLKDNSVNLGDSCTFQLINRKQNLFMVSISRGGHEEIEFKDMKKKKKQIR